MPKRRFTISFKKSVVEEAYAEGGGVRATARAHNIIASTIRGWRHSLERYMQAPPSKRPALGKHRVRFDRTKPLDDDIYEDLKNFYEMHRERGLRVTTTMLRTEALRMKPSLANLSQHALDQRLYRFLHAEAISKRRITHVAQKVRQNKKESEAWVRHINQMVAMYGFDPQLIANLDETNLYFDSVGGFTWADRGSKSVTMKETGSKQRCTNALCL